MEFSKEKNQTQSKIFSKRYFLALFFLLFLVVTFFPAHNADAQYDANFNKNLENSFPGVNNQLKEAKAESCSLWNDLPRCFILIMFKFAGLLLKLSAVVFGWIVDTDNIKLIISDNTAIYSSWTFVRDILNMAFIMVLLFSAFCTIFRIEQYNYKKLLWKIVLMALLVNFSFPIARFIIDASNILMYTLIKSTLFGTTPPGNSFATIANGSELGNLINVDTTSIPNNTQLLANAVIIFMLAITFLAIGILLLIRLIALAILIIFSPIAFVGSIMPGVSSYASQWWDNLFKYSFFGPIMIFGISIAVNLMNAQNKMSGLGKTAQKIAGEQLGQVDANFFGQMAYSAIPIVLLWMVMGIAQKMSIAGAGTVMGAAQGAMKWSAKNLTGYRLTKAAGGAGAHWLNRKMAETKGLRYLSPMAMKDAWKKRTARQDRKALSVSSGAIQNTLEKVIGRAASANPFIAVARFARGAKKDGFKGGLKNIINPSDIDRTDRDYEELQTFANEEKKRITAISDNSDQILHEMNLALNRGLPGDAGTVMAAHASLAKTNDLNEHQAANGKDTDPQELKLTLAAELFAAGMKSSENIAKSLIVTGENAFSANNYAYGAMGRFLSKNDTDDRDKIRYNNVRTVDEMKQFYDLKTGILDKSKEMDNTNLGGKYKAGFYMTTEKEQAEAGAAKFSNLETQSRQRLTHPDTFYNINKDGDVIDVHLGGLKTFEKFNTGDVENAKRARETVQRHAQAWDLYNDPKNTAFKAKIDKLSNAATVLEHLKKASTIIKNPTP